MKSVLKVGTRVQMHPCTDHWMMGDRYGEIVSYGIPRKFTCGDLSVKIRPYYVKLDKSGKTIKAWPDDVLETP